MSNSNLLEPTTSATSSSSSTSSSNVNSNSSSFISYLSSSFKRRNGPSQSPKGNHSPESTAKSSTASGGRRAHSPSASSSPGICRRPTIKTRRPIKVENFEKYFDDCKRDSNYGFSQEFELLNQLCRETIYLQPQIKNSSGKNRYANIIPYEHSIVKLSQIGSDTNTAYINANFVPGHNGEDEYIACQAPLHSTLGDFYRMLIEQKVNVIVNLLERENPPYFPSAVHNTSDDSLNNNPSNDNIMECEVAMEKECPEIKTKIRVVLISDDDHEFYRVRTVDICAEGYNKHRVLQFHYRIWEDFGTPENARTLIDFVRAVRRHVSRTKSSTISGRSSPCQSSSASHSPIVVHCNAGVGRTGTFIAVDQLMQTLMPHDFDSSCAPSSTATTGTKASAGSEWSFKSKTMRLFQIIQNIATNNDRNALSDWQFTPKVSVIDVFGLVYRLRNYRPFLVQTENQYAFIYDCVRLLLRDAGYFGTRKKSQVFRMPDGGK